MRLHSITKTHAHRTARRVGRGNGSGRGTFSGRGVKGQKARSGANSNIPRTFVGGSTALLQRLPKLPGFKSHRVKPVTVNMARIVKAFDGKGTVSVVTLLEKGLISTNEALIGVRIVGATTPSAHELSFDTESGNLTLTKKLASTK
jgi:large subunit ribosomal protein L15